MSLAPTADVQVLRLAGTREEIVQFLKVWGEQGGAKVSLCAPDADGRYHNLTIEDYRRLAKE